MRVALRLSVLVAGATTTTAFSIGFPWSTSTTTQQPRQASTTRLFISSWGTKGSPYTRGDVLENVNPEENVQSYLADPTAVEARSNVDGTCLVSGCVNAKERTDQFLFDLLNDEESAFEFTKIVALVKDAKFSKKRLLSRSARYTGLLDKLEFAEAPDDLPSVEQLQTAKSWLAVIDSNHLAQLQKVAQLAFQVGSKLENVAVLLTGATELDAAASKQVLDQFPHAFNPQFPESDDDDDNAEPPEMPIPPTTFTVVAVGELDEVTPEGQCFYQYEAFGSDDGVIPDGSVFPRAESYRLITELLQLAAGRQRALSFAQVYNPNVTEARLIRGLREAGYARPQELDHMVRQGPAKYLAFIDQWKNRNPDWDKGYSTTDAWWEAEIYQKSRRASAERDAAKEQAVKDERTLEVEAIAKEWAKREYFRQSMAGTLGQDGLTEEDFTKQIWDRAMLEADIKYRQSQGETVDSEDELATFQAQQERKKQTMLKRAKQELAELLDEDPDTLIPPESSDSDDSDKKK